MHTKQGRTLSLTTKRLKKNSKTTNEQQQTKLNSQKMNKKKGEQIKFVHILNANFFHELKQRTRD